MRRLVLLLCAAASVATAQTIVPAEVSVHGNPGGMAIATLPKGAPVRTGSARNGWTQVTLEGWVDARQLNARRDTLDRVVKENVTTSLRSQDGPRQAVIGVLESGTYLKLLTERNGWARVRRSGWVRTAELSAAKPAVAKPAAAKPEAARPEADKPEAAKAEAAKTPPATPKPAPEVASRSVSNDEAGNIERSARATTLLSAPGGTERATIPGGSELVTLSRERGWVRVRLEGWVREQDLTLADSGASSTVTAADLRADPERFRGSTVRWEVTFIALQRADALRKGMAANEPYILIRGPGEDASVVYAAVPTALLPTVRGLTPMTPLIITARVRQGRSDPVGVPILDLMTVAPAR
jgi:hypothetical protein